MSDRIKSAEIGGSGMEGFTSIGSFGVYENRGMDASA
jgi:hypothetical protein